MKPGKTLTRTQRAGTLAALATLCLFLIPHRLIAAEVLPARLTGKVEFINTAPEILSILGLPGREGMVLAGVSAVEIGGEGAYALAYTAVPTDSFLSKRYNLDVQASASGRRYAVSSYISLDNSREFYLTRAIETDPLLPGTTTILDIKECVGLLHIRFVRDLVSRAPVTVDGGRIELQLAGLPSQYPAPFGASSLPRTDQLFLAVRAGENCNVTVSYQRGTDHFSDTVFRQFRTTVNVACDAVHAIDIVVPSEGSLASLAGRVDILGETELPEPTGFEIRPDVANFGVFVRSNFTLVSATIGPFLNYRYLSMPGVPSSGTFVLSNLLPSSAVSPPQPYTIAAGVTFDHTFNHSTPAVSEVTREFFNTPVRRVEATAGETDLGDIFVIDPGYISGTIRLRGPVETPTRPSLLRAFSGARVYGHGVDQLAPGAAYTAAGGIAYSAAPGAFDGASGQFVGHYELALGGLHRQDSIWRQDVLGVGFYTNSPSNPEDRINSSLLITDLTPTDFTVRAGNRQVNDVQYCFGKVILNFNTTAGQLYDPRIVSGGLGNAPDYSIYIDSAVGTPGLRADAASQARVVALLPVGTYNFGTEVRLVAPDGSESLIRPGGMRDLVVGCGEIISVTPPCLSVVLNPARCFRTAAAEVAGHVQSCTNKVSKLTYTLNGVSALVSVNLGLNPPFAIPVSLIGPCTDNELTITAEDETGAIASITTNLRYDDAPPEIHCPPNVTVPCAGPAGTRVDFAGSATDNCSGPVPFTCVPPSGSLFPPGITIVNCKATDLCGYVTNCQFTVSVKDTTPPEIACPPDIFTSCSSSNGAVVTYPVTALDTCASNVTLNCTPPSGATFPLGTSSVTCCATDTQANQACCSFKVTVRQSPVSIERAIIVRWQCGILQAAKDIDGPWDDVPGATSPYCVPSSDPRRFFRTR